MNVRLPTQISSARPLTGDCLAHDELGKEPDYTSSGCVPQGPGSVASTGVVLLQGSAPDDATLTIGWHQAVRDEDLIAVAREVMDGSDATYTAEAGLADSQSKSADAASGEFLLHAESGDEWFKVTRQDGSPRSGEYVLVDRGDALEISFNAVHVSKRESIGYISRVAAEVTPAGELLIRSAGDEVFGVFATSANPIALLNRNGNMIRFDRADCPDAERIARAVGKPPRAALEHERRALSASQHCTRGGAGWPPVGPTGERH